MYIINLLYQKKAYSMSFGLMYKRPMCIPWYASSPQTCNMLKHKNHNELYIATVRM